MKTHLSDLTSFRSLASVVYRPALVGMLSVALLQLGHAAERPAGITRSGAPASEQLWLAPGTIVVTAPDAPASFGFDQAKSGQIESAKERMQELAHDALALPALPSDQAVVVGAGSLVVAPFAALVGAARGKMEKLDAGALSRSEWNLHGALEAMAAQSHLRDALLKVAATQTQRRLLPIQALANPKTSSGPVGAIVETKVEELRLERTGKGDDSFALRMKARARVVRSSDGQVMYDEPFEYLSGTALFDDWTLATAVQTVADTGYRKLAEMAARYGRA